MSRIEAVNPANATGKTKTLLEGVEKKLGMIPNMMRTMAVAPAVLEGYLQFSGALSQGGLPAKVREQIALAVSESNGCAYCLAAHSALGGMAGLSKEEIIDSRSGVATDSRTNAILHIARDIVDQRGRVTDDTLATARKAGLTDGDIAEVAGHVALNVLTNYFNNLAETVVDFPPAQPLEKVTA